MEGIELRGKERKICQNVLTYPGSPCHSNQDIKEELATEKITKLTRREFRVVRVIQVFRLRRVERLSHVGFLFWMPQPHGHAIIDVGHEKMHDIVDSPWQMCANKAALGNPISVQAVNTTE